MSVAFLKLHRFWAWQEFLSSYCRGFRSTVDITSVVELLLCLGPNWAVNVLLSHLQYAIWLFSCCLSTQKTVTIRTTRCSERRPTFHLPLSAYDLDGKLNVASPPLHDLQKVYRVWVYRFAKVCPPRVSCDAILKVCSLTFRDATFRFNCPGSEKYSQSVLYYMTKHSSFHFYVHFKK